MVWSDYWVGQGWIQIKRRKIKTRYCTLRRDEIYNNEVKQPILIVELNFSGAFPVWWKPWLWVKFWYVHLFENEAWVESWLGLLGTDWCLDIVESESSDEAFWAAGSSVPPCPPPARQHRPRLQGDQAQVWPAEDGREWVQLVSPPNLFIWHFHRQGQRRRSAQAPLASPGGWEPTSPSSRERGWEIFMKSFHFGRTKLWMRLERDIPNIENHYSLCYSYSVILEEREYPSQRSHSK